MAETKRMTAEQVVAYLLERGADASVKDGLGRTALDLAVTPVQGRPVPNSERIAEMLKGAALTARATPGA